MNRPRLAVVVSHPIQYYSPWFRHIAAKSVVDLHVYYLWDFGTTEKHERTFDRSFSWDVPLLEGYKSTFVANVSRDPGTHHFGGLNNPSLLSQVMEFRPDVVLVFGYAWRSQMSFLFRRPRKLPVMMRGDSHLLASSARPSSIGVKLKRRLTRAVLRYCDYALAVGKSNAQFYVANGVPTDRIALVPHCVDNGRFAAAAENGSREQFRRSHELEDDAIVVAFVGKFEPKKRPDMLLSAFKRLASESARLMLVGDGVLRPQLERMADGDRRIRLLPFQNQSAIPSVYAAADILVLPSYGPGETWGLVVNEAMNAGCAVIVSSHVGCAQDLVHVDRNGWIFAAGDEESLSECLRVAVSNPQRLRDFGRYSRDLIRSYSYDVATTKLLEAMSSVIHR